MLDTSLLPLAGGAMIGAAAALLLLTHGRIAGISGILGELLRPDPAPDRSWRLAFLGGLLAAGAVGEAVSPTAIGAQVHALPIVIGAGLLVGFGSRLGGGCTSGHGVCGVARLSVRSLVATATFVTTGVLAAWIAGGVS